ncbi:MAG: Zinc-specific metallo-regulatory protein [Firmicutes bacterium]|nr:Zinc-specific metallo-regulatory protein [candidate division NPL-UPA2 bacterium]
MTKVQAADLLRRNGIKKTRQREAVVRILAEAQAPLSVDSIHVRLRHKDDSVNLSTIYRMLEVLLEKGLVEQMHHPLGSKFTYVLSAYGHSHHLTCTRCGVSTRMDSCPVTTALGQLEASHNFHITGHRLEVFGVCAACKSK